MLLINECKRLLLFLPREVDSKISKQVIFGKKESTSRKNIPTDIASSSIVTIHGHNGAWGRLIRDVRPDKNVCH